jgi:hypothetical protein
MDSLKTSSLTHSSENRCRCTAITSRFCSECGVRHLQDMRNYNNLIAGSFKRSAEAASHNAYLRSRFLISSKASATLARLRPFNSG